jgi:hypothetical protein
MRSSSAAALPWPRRPSSIINTGLSRTFTAVGSRPHPPRSGRVAPLLLLHPHRLLTSGALLLLAGGDPHMDVHVPLCGEHPLALLHRASGGLDDQPAWRASRAQVTVFSHSCARNPALCLRSVRGPRRYLWNNSTLLASLLLLSAVILADVLTKKGDHMNRRQSAICYWASCRRLRV